MWKKDEAMPTAQPSTARVPGLESPGPVTGPMAEAAIIGRSITIRGEVGGDEDLLIQGNVDGSVDLQLQSVTVGREGKVKGNITGRVVTVEGEVQGDLRAQEQVILRGSAQVKGDLTAPRVVLEDGASFRGLVDMGDPSESAKSAAVSSKAKRTPNSESNGSPAEADSVPATLPKSPPETDKGASGAKGAGRAAAS